MASMVAQMWGDSDHMGGGTGWWWVMGIGWLVFLALVATLLSFIIRQAADRGRRPASHGAEDLLADRFARGEIDEDEYRQRREALRG
jgi:putative membrane protein